MANKVFLGLGSNKGDRKEYILKAVEAISKNKKCRVIKLSSIYETTPYGMTDQQNFYNAAAEIETELEIEELYKFIKLVEAETGREESTVRWGPREIDVDILFYNNLIYSSDKLTIPHKEILQRDFVIIPLKEIAAEFVHPVLNKKLGDIDTGAIAKHIIRKIDFSTKHNI